MYPRRIILMLVIGLGAAATIGAEVPPEPSPDVTYIAAPESGLATVNGTSTLHDWKVTTGIIGGWVVVNSGPKALALTTADLTIDVKSLKSTEGSGMDKHVYAALKSDKHPSIHYRLKSAKADGQEQADAPRRRLDTTGELTIAGVTRSVSLQLLLESRPDGLMLISTRTPLKMTDFGIDPPTAMLGVIKSGNDITVDVQWRLMQKPAEGGGK